MICPQTLDQLAAAGEATLRTPDGVDQEAEWDPPRSRGLNARDIHLARQVEHLLRAADPERLKSVRVDAAGCCVRLSGQVATYYAKQLAQAAAMNAEGVSKVFNQIEVE